ncbi:coactosin-like protein [Gigantopelta aegis]|uniref:coactosin-like protein n=1 Tax=Gigantopelta aegis TaxID=1735272 RepID=UPI001B88BD5D|nr:coactosin-like protein [Gigantopelta aegis]
MTSLDKPAIREAYIDIRNDNSDVSWAILKYEGNKIVLDSTGSSYEEFQSKLTDDTRAFGYVRITTGDEMSKRAKFALITWAGPDVSTLKKAKMGPDKSRVKEVIQNFAVELHITEQEELEQDFIKSALMKAGGANYGTGQ